MPETTVTDKLIAYLNDAYAMEQNVEQMLQSMIATTEDADLTTRLEQHLEETRRQAGRIEACLQAHGESPSGMKAAAAKVGAAAKGMFDAVRGDKAGRNLRDAYVTEHMEIAAYRLLERVAERAGDGQSAEAARANLAEEEEMVRFLDGRWDVAVELSLREEGVAA